MVCEKSNELMMRYMDGLLDSFDEMNLTKHIETCETCREDFEIYKEMLVGFDLKNMEIVDAPDGFDDAVMAQIDNINIYFPEKVRNKGVILDRVIFVAWGLMAATIAAGLTLFLFNEQIFAWLYEQGLYGAATALYPIASYVADFGTTAAAFFGGIIGRVFAIVAEYWLAITIAVAGLAGLAVLTLYLAPRSVRSANSANIHKKFKAKA